MYNGPPTYYQTGQRFSLAGIYGRRSGLGDVVIDCTDPNDEGCQGGAPSAGSGGLDLNTLLQQGLTDVTQLLAPGTPSPVRVYTPATTAAASFLSNPLLLLGLAAGVVFLLKRR